jgi:Tetratricopeptide repeat
LVLIYQSKYQQAQEMHRQALGLCETVLGREHSDIMTSIYCLAYLLHLQQRLSEAGPFHRRALTSYGKTQGSGHPTTEVCRKRYSSTLKDMDDLDTEA